MSKRIPSVTSSVVPNAFDSSTVTTPSLPTRSMASAMRSPISVSAAEMDAVAAISSLVSTSLAFLRSCSVNAATALSIPRRRLMGSAPAATLRSPSRTMACARTTDVVVPSPATSSVFLATSLTSSAPIFSNGSSSSISFAIETPSFVMVGAPHFFSNTTLRPRGPSVTLTASAKMLRPRSRPRRASSLNAINLAMMCVCPPGRRSCHWHSRYASANCKFGTLVQRVQIDCGETSGVSLENSHLPSEPTRSRCGRGPA